MVALLLDYFLSDGDGLSEIDCNHNRVKAVAYPEGGLKLPLRMPSKLKIVSKGLLVLQ